jgi:hypothetical protein
MIRGCLALPGPLCWGRQQGGRQQEMHVKAPWARLVPGELQPGGVAPPEHLDH